MKFFFDRQISVHLARMLSHFDRDNVIVHQDDDGRFAEDDDDVHLITTVSRDQPRPVIWVTADIAQKRKPQERIALRDSGMSVVFLRRFNNQSPHYQAVKLLVCWPLVCESCANCRVPTAFEIPAGKMTGAKVDNLGPMAQLFR